MVGGERSFGCSSTAVWEICDLIAIQLEVTDQAERGNFESYGEEDRESGVSKFQILHQET